MANIFHTSASSISCNKNQTLFSTLSAMYSIVYPGIWKGLYVERCNWQERHCSVIRHLRCTFFYILESSALWAQPRGPLCLPWNLQLVIVWRELPLQLTQCIKCNVYHCSIFYLIFRTVQLGPKCQMHFVCLVLLYVYPRVCKCEQGSQFIHCM